MNERNIGLIGVGLMGHGIARNLLKAGHRLVVLEHPGNQPLDELVGSGATTATTAEAVASVSEFVILCVTGTPEVEDAITGTAGVAAGLKPQSIVIDCSTAMPSSSERLAALVAAAGGRFLDAAMTRTPREAHEGRLNLLVGGDVTTLEASRPILACFAENITHVGPVGAGHRLKLLHNFVSLGFVALLAEAAACAELSGISPQVFIDVLERGGGAGTALDRLRPYLTSGDVGALRFSLANAEKDLTYYAAMARESDSATAIAAGVLQTVSAASAELGGSAFVPELVTFLSQGGRRDDRAIETRRPE